MFLGIRLTRISIVATCAAAFIACGAPPKSAAAGKTESTHANAVVSGAFEVTDDAGQTLRFTKPATRIISLIPSAMETLIAIGATPQIVGRTRYDVAAEIMSLPSVGGGIDPSIEAIVNLHPDLVISWESDKRQLVREKLTALGVPVFILRTQDTTDIFRGIGNIGRMAGHDSAASAITASVRATLDSIHRAVAGRPTPSVFYVVYNDPPMTAGPNTFTGQLISLAGGRSIFGDETKQWPNVAMEEIVRRDPDMLVVPVGEVKGNALERFRSMAGWRDLRAVRTGRVYTVPADLMSRPSPSIAAAAHVFFGVFHPEVAGADSAKHGVTRARP